MIAHELFHRWRHATGRMTSDAWHEEYAANRLAVGYLRRFHPETLARTLELSERVLLRFERLLDSSVYELLDDCQRPCPEGRAYGMDLRRAAVVHLEMVRQLARQAPDLDSDARSFLPGQ